MKEMIEKINSILRYQKNFKWQNIHYYNGYKDSFEYHVKHHPIDERKTGKWDMLIKYDNNKTIADSYYNVSVNLAQKFSLIPTGQYDVQYIKQHESINIVNNNNGLIVCLKCNPRKICFDIATCFFPYKINNLLSIGTKIFPEMRAEKRKANPSGLNYMMYNEPISENNELNEFKEAMGELFGINSIEYKILFYNEINNVNGLIDNITTETMEYLNFMENLIKNEEDRKYYFIFSDGIKYIAKLTLLYKLKNQNYKKLYEKFLKIDIKNSYKNALDKCEKYIDEGEKNYGKGN